MRVLLSRAAIAVLKPGGWLTNIRVRPHSAVCSYCPQDGDDAGAIDGLVCPRLRRRMALSSLGDALMRLRLELGGRLSVSVAS